MTPQIETTPFWQTLDFWSFLIALIALLVALYSVWYTKQRDKLSLEITDATFEELECNPFFVCFSVFNNSSSAVKITDIRLCNQDGTPASLILGHEYQPSQISESADLLFPPVYIPEPYYFEAPFINEVFILANDSMVFKYYINPFTPNMIISITSDKPIHRWSKTKTFSVHFVKTD